MKKILPILALAVVFLGCAKKETVSVLVLPEFQIDGKKTELPEGILRTTAFELILSRPIYDQVKEKSRFKDYDSWKQGLRLTPVRNTNLIEIQVEGSDKKEVERILEALQQAAPTSYDGKTGTIQWTIIEKANTE